MTLRSYGVCAHAMCSECVEDKAPSSCPQCNCPLMGAKPKALTWENGMAAKFVNFMKVELFFV